MLSLDEVHAGDRVNYSAMGAGTPRGTVERKCVGHRVRSVSGTITLADQHDSTQPSSFPRFAAVEALECEQDLTSLAPKRGLIPAQSVKGIGRQVV